MASLSVGAWVGIGLGALAVIWLVANKDKVKTTLGFGGGTSPVADLNASVAALLSNVKADVLQSPAVRSACCTVLVHLENVVETFPNEKDKFAGREHVKGLVTLLAVKPADAETPPV